MTLESVVCWRWKPAEWYRSQYPPSTVNTLRAMVARWYPKPVRFICVTDDPTGLDPRIEALPPWNDYADVKPPQGGKNPSCYRRLRAYHPEAAQWFGQRFAMLDLDTVITGDLLPLFDRPEDIVLAGDTNPSTFYNGGLLLMTAGCRPQVWETFDPVKSPHKAKVAGHYGSDQGWISYCLGPHEAKFTKAHGVYSLRNDFVRQRRKDLPADCRLVMFHGNLDPWKKEAGLYPWVDRFYHDREEVAA